MLSNFSKLFCGLIYKAFVCRVLSKRMPIIQFVFRTKLKGLGFAANELDDFPSQSLISYHVTVLLSAVGSWSGD